MTVALERVSTRAFYLGKRNSNSIESWLWAEYYEILRERWQDPNYVAPNPRENDGFRPKAVATYMVVEDNASDDKGAF